MSNIRKLRENNYKIKPFSTFLAGAEAYIDILEDYESGNSMETEQDEIDEILEHVCSIQIPTKNRISGVRLREIEAEEGLSLELWIYSVQDTERGRDIQKVEMRGEYAPGLGMSEYELTCDEEDGEIFLIGAENTCYGVPAFEGRLAIYAEKEEDLDFSCEMFLAISWEDAEDLIERIFEVEEVSK